MFDNFSSICNPYKPTPKWKSIIKTTLYLVLIIVVSFSFIYLASHYAKPVHGVSMQPTLNTESDESRDIVLINKFAEPTHSDIVIINVTSIPFEYSGISSETTLIIKRVIAVAGDRLKLTYNDETETTQVYLNGTLLQENYINTFTSKSLYLNFVSQTHWQTVLEKNDYGEVTIPDGMIFCMGDNRDNSRDCRYFGPVSLNTLEGVVDCVLPDGTFWNDALTELFNFT